jgi:hypothetical protein
VYGYAITIGDNVPLRGAASQNSSVKDFLPKDTVVYVIGQEYPDGIRWDAAYYKNDPGYVRHDQLRMLTRDEALADEQAQNTVAPPPTYSPLPLDPNSTSAYGYVTANSTNFRSKPATNAAIIRSVNKYTFAMILGSEVVNGVTWYKVSVGGTQGYIHGDFFKVLSLRELDEFLASPNYITGQTPSTGSGSGSSSSGGSSSGSPVPQEDVNIDEWKSNPALTASYEPFDPFATPEPIEDGDDTEADDDPEETMIPTLEPLNTQPPEVVDDHPGSNPLGVILTVLGIALVGGGGAYGYSIYRTNQKKAAAREAQRRAAAQQAQRPRTPGGPPYTRPLQTPPGPGMSQRPVPGPSAAPPQRPGVPTPSPIQPPGGTGRAHVPPPVSGAAGAVTHEAYRRPQSLSEPPANRPQDTSVPDMPLPKSSTGISPVDAPSAPDGPDTSAPSAPRRHPRSGRRNEDSGADA